jgi:hypothetical protein
MLEVCHACVAAQTVLGRPRAGATTATLQQNGPPKPAPRTAHATPFPHCTLKRDFDRPRDLASGRSAQGAKKKFLIRSASPPPPPRLPNCGGEPVGARPGRPPPRPVYHCGDFLICDPCGKASYPVVAEELAGGPTSNDERFVELVKAQMQGAGSYSKEELAAAKFVVRGLLH